MFKLKLLFLLFLNFNLALADSKKGEPKKAETNLMANFSGKDSKQPIDIKSDILTLNSKDRIFTYQKNVVMQQGETKITADLAEGRYGEDNQIKNVLFRGNVVITKGDATKGDLMKATSNRAFYDVTKSTIVMTENPEIDQGGNILQADKVTVFVDQDRSEAEGNVSVKVTKTTEVKPQ